MTRVNELVSTTTRSTLSNTPARSAGIRLRKRPLAGKKVPHRTSRPTAAQDEIAGSRLQSQPKHFSQPELRIFSWGFEGEARFSAPAKALSASAAARVRIRGQACTQTVCKNVDCLATIIITDQRQLLPPGCH